MNGYKDVDRNICSSNLKKAVEPEDMRKYSFSQTVINEWNKLPNDCVNASSVNMLKIELTDN